MEYISVFDMLKIGVGPSSSHTLGPWRACENWLFKMKESELFEQIKTVHVDLYGSLSLTGKGHATDKAVILGLSGCDPERVPIDQIKSITEEVDTTKILHLSGEVKVAFDPKDAILFNNDFLPFHSNGIKFTATLKNGNNISEVYYSIGGGFIVQEKNDVAAVEIKNDRSYPFPIQNAEELADYCNSSKRTISSIVFENEKMLRAEEEIDFELKRVWNTMLECMYIGCHTEGKLPGGLNVKRRAYEMHKKLAGTVRESSPQEWLENIRNIKVKFRQILKWVSCFALSVNEVNASLGRVVTAPTNGSAGVIPSVLMYYLVIENHQANFEHIRKFLLVAGEIGTDQVLIAAEIAMEHHLGLTCDPIGGLVQIPCIERNAMGAIKAINASELAIDTDPDDVKVPLDKVINTMWETAKDMHTNYKETSKGGLAVGVGLADC